MHKNIPYILLSILLLALLFAQTVRERYPYLGKLSKNGLDSTTAHVLTTMSNWRETGAFHNRFFSSLGPETPDSRASGGTRRYISYPSGAFVLPYFFSKALATPVTLEFLNILGLVIQAAIAVILYLLAFLLLREHRILTRVFGATCVSAAYLLFPGPMYFHQNVFIFDTLVILPYLLAVYCELHIMKTDGRRSFWQWIQYLSLFAASCTDWLSAFLGLGLMTLRLMRGENFRVSLRMMYPFVWSMIIFVYQLGTVGGLFALANRFQHRVGISKREPITTLTLAERFWGDWIPSQYGNLAWVIIAAACLILLMPRVRRQRASPLFVTVFLLLVPPLMQIHLFRNHSFFHAFSALKLAPLICMAPLLSLAFPKRGARVLPVVCTLALSYAVFVHRSWKSIFPEPDTSGMKIAYQLNQNTEPEDFIISPQLSIGIEPNQLISLSQRMVHRVRTVGEAREIAQNLRLQPKNWVVVLKEKSDKAFKILRIPPEGWIGLDANETLSGRRLAGYR